MTDRANGVIHYLSVVICSLSSMSFNQWISLFMLLLGLGTFIVNVYYKKRMLEISEKKLQRDENNE